MEIENIYATPKSNLIDENDQTEKVELQSNVYPTILRRYLSTSIDSIFIISISIGVGYLFQNENEGTTYIRVIVILLLCFGYEPICTCKCSTLGQLITGIRIRSNETQRRISMLRAYLRIISKITFGFISFFSIIFSKRKRAIHDIIAGTVVLVRE